MSWGVKAEVFAPVLSPISHPQTQEQNGSHDLFHVQLPSNKNHCTKRQHLKKKGGNKGKYREATRRCHKCYRGWGSVAEIRGDARQSDSLSLSASFTSTLNLYSWSQPM